MIWKPKERELTPEEAVALAKKELAPLWFGSTPLVAGVQSGNQTLAIPLISDFTKKSWLILFIDPTDFNGEAATFYLKEWFKRFDQHELHVFCIYSPVYKFLMTSNFVVKARETQEINFPIAIDADGSLCEAFGARVFPKFVLHDSGKPILIHEGQGWQKDFELKIHQFLRSRDPGLPLQLPFDPPKEIIFSKDVSRLELGFSPKSGTSAQFISNPNEAFQLIVREEKDSKKKKDQYEEPKKEPEIQKLGVFTGSTFETLPENSVFISGTWIQEDQKITTSDPAATLVFNTSVPRVSLLAQAGTKETESSPIFVEIDQAPAYEGIAGEHLVLDDSGRSVIKVSHAQLYHLLVNLPSPLPKQLQLRFPNAASVPVTLYGIRFGS